MGDPTGFVKLTGGPTAPTRPIPLRVLDWREIEEAAAARSLREQGARCMDCGVPFCQADTGCPVQNLDPRVERPRAPGPLARGAGRASRHQQLPRVHRPASAPRRARRRACSGSSTSRWRSRASSRRSSTTASPRGGCSRSRRRRRRGSGWRWWAPAPPGSPPRSSFAVPATRSRCSRRDDRLGRSAPLRHPRLQAGEVGDRPPPGADGGGGGGVPHRRRRGARPAGGGAAARLRRGAAGRRRAGRRATWRSPGASWAGIHFAMEYLAQQNRRVAGDRIDPAGGDQRRGQAGGGDRRRRHRRRLPGHRAPAGGRGGVPARDLPAAAAGARARHPLALLADAAQHLPCARGGRRAGVERGDARLLRRGRPGPRGCTPCGSEVTRTRPGAGTSTRSPETEFDLEVDLVLLAMGFTGARTHVAPPRRPRRGARRPRGVVQADAELPHQRAEGVFAAGDAYRGASLVVWAIREGRDAARGHRRVPEVVVGHRLSAIGRRHRPRSACAAGPVSFRSLA